MKKLNLLIAAVIIAASTISCGTARHAASILPEEDIIVLYENDVHCGVDGYANFAALKNEMLESHKYVKLVSNGDFVQGGSLGAASHGRNIIDIMNEVGYDYVTLGNHEFDYGIPRMTELMDDLDATALACNFKDLRTGKQLLKSYDIVNCGNVDIAFIGMSTPYTITSSTPTYFKDEDGGYIYSFSIENFYDVVQEAVDAARKDGAEYVIVLSHLGDENEGEGGVNSPSMIENTYGIDVVLDGHSHSVIPQMYFTNKKGEKVLLTSTGTKFENMGVLTLDRAGNFTSKLVPTASYTAQDAAVARKIQEIKDGYQKVANQVVCTSDEPLRIYGEDGERYIRNRECGIGNFCTDAYRIVFDADIAALNGGGIRADLPGGDITFNDIFTMFPFEKTAVTCDVTGATILDMLEMSVSIAPDEFGGFYQVSGMKFEYNSSIPSPVVYDNDHNFAGVNGERRVKNVWILDKESGEYKPLEKDKTYFMAASNYLVKDFGDGFTMMKECTNVKDTGMVDTDMIENFITNWLDRHIGDKYYQPEGRIIDLAK